MSVIIPNAALNAPVDDNLTCKLLRELEVFRSGGVAEICARNSRVMEYIKQLESERNHLVEENFTLKQNLDRAIHPAQEKDNDDVVGALKKRYCEH